MSAKIEFEAPEFSEGARALANVFSECGISSNVILMLAREFKKDRDVWSGCISVLGKGETEERLNLYDDVFTAENVKDIYRGLLKKSLIGNFNKSFKMINYLMANFPDAFKIYIQEKSDFPTSWIYHELHEVSLEGRAKRYNQRYEWCCNEGISEPFNAAARSFIYSALSLEEKDNFDFSPERQNDLICLPGDMYAQIMTDIYGKNNKYCGYCVVYNEEILKLAKEALAKHAKDAVGILMLRIPNL